jgi:DNA-binding transcriptional LysR family regulator
MPTLRRSIPSLGALATFEAAARLGSFTLAAGELGVTQAAVSRQIKALEDDLHTPLFRRTHRKVTLTPAGAALAGSVTVAFASMAEMIETIRRPALPDTITIGATLAFSQLWILPRLRDFRMIAPDCNIKIVSDDRPVDLRRDRLDALVRFGRPPFADGLCLASRADEVFPVCSPRLLARLGCEAATADIATLPLIASDIVDPSWLTWRAWAQAVGLGPAIGRASDQSRLRFDHYTETIEAALAAEGVALGWSVLLERHLEAGTLVRIGTRSRITEDSYCLVVPTRPENGNRIHVFCDWMARTLTATVPDNT